MRPPRPPLQPPAVALEPRAIVKLQPDVDIDLGQQRNLDSATQAAERECRHGRSQLGMRADVTAALAEAHRDVEPSVAHGAPPPRRPQPQPSRAGASVKRHAGSGQEAGLACVTGLGADRRGLAGYPLTDRRQFDILQCGPRSACAPPFFVPWYIAPESSVARAWHSAVNHHLPSKPLTQFL
jgi:hypothetical protein